MACKYIYNGIEYTEEELKKVYEQENNLIPVYRGDVDRSKELYFSDGALGRAIYLAGNINQALENGLVREFTIPNNKIIRFKNSLEYTKAVSKTIDGKLPTKADYNNYLQNQFNQGNIIEISKINGRPEYLVGNPEIVNYVADIDVISDNLISMAGEPIIRIDKARIKEIKDKIKNYSDKRDKSTKLDVKNNYGKAINNLYKELSNLKLNKETLANIESIEDLENVFKSSYEYVQKLFSKTNFSTAELEIARSYINTFIAASDTLYSEDPHIFLTEDEKNTEWIQKKVQEWAIAFVPFKNRLDKYNKEQLYKAIEDTTNIKLNKAEKEKLLKDIGYGEANFRNLGEQDHLLQQTIFLQVNKANNLAALEYDSAKKNRAKLFKDAKNDLDTLGQDIFRQTYTDGKLTGDLVQEFNVDFVIEESILRKELSYSRFKYEAASKASDKSIKKGIYQKKLRKYNEFLNNNTTILNPYLIEQDDTLGFEELNGYISAEKIFSTTDDSIYNYEEHRNSLAKKIKRFKEDRLAKYYALLDGKDSLTIDEQAEFNKWISLNSPYEIYDNYADVTKDKTFRYIETVPNKPELYDSKFIQINERPALKALYRNIYDTFKENYSIVGESSDYMRFSSIPLVKNNIMDMFAKDGVSAGFKGLYSAIQESFRESDIDETDFYERDLLTGEYKQKISVPITSFNNKQIQDLVDTKIYEYQKENGVVLTGKELFDKKIEFQKEVIDTIHRESKFDLENITNVYTLQSLAYKHKSAIQPLIRMAERFYKETNSAELNKDGSIKKDAKGNVITTQTFEKAKESLEYYLNSTYYNTRANAVEGATKNRILTNEEKELIKELTTRKEEYQALYDKAIAEGKEDEANVLYKNIVNIDKQIKELGGNFTWGKAGDNLLKYVTLKGLGYNIFSATSNMLFGYLSNLTEAADGRKYTLKQLHQAYSLVRYSVANNYGGNTDTGNKIRALMDRFRVVNSVTNENQKLSESAFSKRLKGLGPLSMQERSEYLNNAPVLIAMMMNTKVMLNGKEVSLFDAYDNEGNLLDGVEFSNEQEANLMTEINTVVINNHGDYVNPIAAKKSVIYRGLLTFRTWMIQGIAQRFEKEKTVAARNQLRKGRYRSYVDFFKAEGIKAPFVLMKETLTLLTNQSKAFEGRGLSELDAANMRKNVMGILELGAVLAISMIIKAGFDDEEEMNPFAIFTLNQLDRLESDLLFYTNPKEFQKINSNAFAALGTLNDLYRVYDSMLRYVDDRPTTLESGPFEGMNAVALNVGKSLPVSSQILRTYRDVNKLYDNVGTFNRN